MQDARIGESADQRITNYELRFTFYELRIIEVNDYGRT